jgi:hypothetical protein
MAKVRFYDDAPTITDEEWGKIRKELWKESEEPVNLKASLEKLRISMLNQKLKEEEVWMWKWQWEELVKAVKEDES